MTEDEHSCNRRFELHLTIDGKPMAKAYYCELDVDHPGLHRSTMYGQERARVWTDDGIDFLEGPYGPASDPDSLTCSDHFDDPDGTTIFCVRPKGHSGQHGNYHDEDSPTYWANSLPIAWSSAPLIEGDIIHADFEVVIGSGHIAIPTKVRLNGLDLPNVKDVTVEYTQGDARAVVVEFLATSVTEVPK